VHAREHLSVENVDLEVTDPHARDQLAGAAVGPADHRWGAGDQIVRHEGETDVVIGASLEGVELPAQIAAPSEGDDPDRPGAARLVDELDPPTGLDVDINEKQMGLPLFDRASALGDRP